MSDTSPPPASDFETELAALLNKYSMDNGCNTPDYVLARHLIRQLDTFREINQEREAWFGTPLRIGNSDNSSNESPMGSTSEGPGNN